MSGKWAPDNDEGLHAYVIETTSWGRTTSRIDYAADLAEAKRKYGWTRMQHTSAKVRRATPADVETTR